MPAKSKTRFFRALAQGFTRSEAAKIAHVRSRTTAQRWENEYRSEELDTSPSTPPPAPDPIARVIAAALATVEAESAKVPEVRCGICGYPASAGCPHAKTQPKEDRPAEVILAPEIPDGSLKQDCTHEELAAWRAAGIEGGYGRMCDAEVSSYDRDLGYHVSPSERAAEMQRQEASRVYEERIALDRMYGSGRLTGR